MLLLCVSVSKTKAFASVGPQVACVLSVAVMEVVHPLFGWVKSSAVTTAMQVGHSSRAVSCSEHCSLFILLFLFSPSSGSPE